MPRKGCKVLGIVIPVELDRELRELLDARKGTISEFVVEAIREKIERVKGV